MGFAKRRRSIIKAGYRRRIAFAVGVCLCLTAYTGPGAAQVPGLGAPQKKVFTFTFGLGSAELSERYGRNAASMEEFGKLIGQLAQTPSARIDSIVVTSYSTTAEQLGSVEVAERRIDAVKAYMEPVIRSSQLRQPVVVTGNVVARNNVIAPDMLFDMLKKTTVTVYLNGVLVAKAAPGSSRAGSAAEEERRYMSPFGEKDVFGRGNDRQKTVEIVPAVKETVPAAEREESTVSSLKTGAESKKETVADPDLQRYIDSLTVSDRRELPGTVSVGEGEKKEVATPPAPVITEEEPCPEDRDPEIDDLIRRLLAEEAAIVPPVEKAEAAEMEIAAEPVMAEMEKIKIKPVKEQRVRPVKPVKAPREALVLPRPLVAVKTNLAYWAAVAANLEVEFYFAQRWSAAVEGVYTDWNMNLYKKHYAVNEISPEIRYWTGRKAGQYRGLYIGVYGHAGQFDYMFKNQQTGNTGDYYGAGVSLGGYLPFTRRFGMELGLRGGWVHAGNYDRYYYDAPYYMWKSSHTANYFGLTGAKVSLVYRFGLGEAGRK